LHRSRRRKKGKKRAIHDSAEKTFPMEAKKKLLPPVRFFEKKRRGEKGREGTAFFFEVVPLEKEEV